MTDTSAKSSLADALLQKPKRKVVLAIGPRLRILLAAVLGMVALLGANSIYLASITALEWTTGLSYQDFFYQYMFLLHLLLGLLLIVPFIVFGTLHLLASKDRRNRRAVWIGYALFAVGIAVLITGVLLMRVGVFDLKQPLARSMVYWLHVLCPLASIWLYWLHRLVGPRIKWRVGLSYAATVGVIMAVLVVLRSQDPRQWSAEAPKAGEKYFKPSLAKTASGNFIPARVLMDDEYCKKCHEDAYEGWFHSAHRYSSFNNPAYLASIRETREVVMKRDGNIQASRFCAGCHDPAPFFSGAFDDPNYDDVNDPTAHAGITCVACHSIIDVPSNPRGNAEYIIEEPMHYPFAHSKNSILQFINNQMVKAKPSFHKKTFLKPLHKTAEFCAACHKVHLPREVTHYRDFLRAQNFYDNYLLSGVSGHGARSFYYPKKAETNCNECHMPHLPSGDFGAQIFTAEDKSLSIHDHLFPSANSGVAWLLNDDKAVQAHIDFLKETMRVDIFGLKEGGVINGQLTAPLRPEIPMLKPGEHYLLETVIRTLKLGHLFTQGTTDSNELWMDVTVSSGGRIIGRSGGMDELGEVDRWSHFVNVFMLDKKGNRINRRNAQDIFVPLYNHQIPPGAGQVVHYSLQLPEDLTGPVVVEVKLQYRKFDREYMSFIAETSKPGDFPIRGHEPGQPYVNRLPVMTLASDRITFEIEGSAKPAEEQTFPTPPWERWNDYGIGLLLEGRNAGGKGELRQAEQAFAEVERLGRYDGPLNLARVYFTEGRLDEAVEALRRAGQHDSPPAPKWTMAWFSGLINKQQGNLDKSIVSLRSILEDNTPEMIERKFDFSLDYVVINELGQTLFERAKQERGDKRKQSREDYLRRAVARFEKTLTIDSENVAAHYNLSQIYGLLGEQEKASEHQKLHARYKPDDNARDRALALARRKYPAANHAAEALVIYSLNRPGAPAASAPGKINRNDQQEGESSREEN